MITAIKVHICNTSIFIIKTKAKNVVTLSVDDIFAQPGIGVPGVSSTDTKHGLFIGGHPKPERLTALQVRCNTRSINFVFYHFFIRQP